MSSTICEALNLWLDAANPNGLPIKPCGMPKRLTPPGSDRFIGFDLTHPVAESGARNRGVVRAYSAAINVFWRHDHDRHTIDSIQSLAPAQDKPQ